MGWDVWAGLSAAGVVVFIAIIKLWVIPRLWRL